MKKNKFQKLFTISLIVSIVGCVASFLATVLAVISFGGYMASLFLIPLMQTQTSSGIPGVEALAITFVILEVLFTSNFVFMVVLASYCFYALFALVLSIVGLVLSKKGFAKKPLGLGITITSISGFIMLFNSFNLFMVIPLIAGILMISYKPENELNEIEEIA